MKNIGAWKAYPEFPFVEVSPLGDVRTLDKVVSNGRGMYVVKGHVLKQRRDRYGYLQVCFRANGKNVFKLVHRLVAETFIPNPNKLPQVNHKDCNRTNNSANNLEWCDNSYNQKYREKYGMSNTKVLGHPLFAINLETLEVSKFLSQRETSRKLGIILRNIQGVLKGRRNNTHGYWFVNADDNAV